MKISEGLRLIKHPMHPWVFSRFSGDTLVRFGDYCANLRLAEQFRHRSGAIVECGTWRGGMIAGLASRFGPGRAYYLFDSFEGLPAAQEIDGDSARRWQADTRSPEYYDNCRASLEDAERAMRRAGVPNAKIVKGWFEETLPRAVIPEGIALLRMDADWYASTRCVLDNLFHQVVPGGGVIVDDYHCWDGCARAVHDFLSREKRSERIRTFNDRVAYIIKND